MVDDAAQLYTMEGIAAAFVILATVYLVAGTTSIYTPGDSHITDMQMEVLGNDVLLVMDTPVNGTVNSTLHTNLYEWNGTAFGENFSRLINERVDGNTDSLSYSATVSYRTEADGSVANYPFNASGIQTGYEQAVRVTRLVEANYSSGQPAVAPVDWPLDERAQVVMLEVLIWRS